MAFGPSLASKTHAWINLLDRGVPSVARRTCTVQRGCEGTTVMISARRWKEQLTEWLVACPLLRAQWLSTGFPTLASAPMLVLKACASGLDQVDCWQHRKLGDGAGMGQTRTLCNS